jgi:hypothetical protein
VPHKAPERVLGAIPQKEVNNVTTEEQIQIIHDALQAMIGMLKEISNQVLTEPDRTTSTFLLGVVEQSVDKLTQ